MPKHTGLGKGLDALIPSSGFQQEQAAQADGEAQPRNMGGVLTVPVDQIVPNPRQPRSHFEPVALEELAASIKEHGIIQPLLVSRDDQGTGYTLIAGERRWQASKLAGLAEVPVIVRQTSDQQKLELALIENVQRAELNPIETALAYMMNVAMDRRLASASGGFTTAASHAEISQWAASKFTLANMLDAAASD